MTLPTSGPLSINDIAGEFGGTAPHSMNEYYAGGGLVPAGASGTYGAVPSSGQISIQNFYGTAAQYQISRSLRFNQADSAYLSRTPSSSPTSNQKFTLSCWFKRTSTTGTYPTIYSANDAQTGGAYPCIVFYDDQIYLQLDTGGTARYWLTSQVFRDFGAWYHIVWAVDTTQATATNRIKLYVNGSLVTAWSVQETIHQNGTVSINAATEQNIGKFVDYSRYIDGYLTEFYMIDGQQLTASSFGQTNADTGVWEPIGYTGSYGTNGFYLPFSDNTSTTTLGYDESGNNNDWTLNSFSVTAGSGNDSLVDTPTNYGTDTGAGGEVRGNYATFNALTPTGNTLTNGNLDAAAAAAAWRGSFSTIGVSSGKWYMEFNIVGGTYARQIIGIALNAATNSSSFYGYGFISGSQYMGRSVGAIPVDYSTGSMTSLSPTTDFDNGDVVGLCIDADAGKLWVLKNNTIIEGTVGGTANVTWTAGSLVFPVASMYSGDSVYANFGQRPFAYTAPSGFKALCTENLSTPTILDGGEYFNALLYNGNGNTGQTVTGVGFQPDFVWLKNRNIGGGYYHCLFDAVRGAGYRLKSNSTDQEANATAIFSAFTSDGFTFPAGQGNTIENDSAGTYVTWNWKANGAGSSNTAGTISSTVSANTTSGFSVVTYTGTGSNATVGHGIGIAPTFIIVKRRNSSTAWPCMVKAANNGNGQNGRLNLDETASYGDNIEYWNNTAPTSTVFSVGIHANSNGSGGTYVAYCFAPVEGFSAFGSYTGNGSTDGPFVYTGFRPAYVLIKCSSNANTEWEIRDNQRLTYNPETQLLFANSTDTTYASDPYYKSDLLSNGFKLRNTNSASNASGYTYIYAAFAENPFKYALAR